jgi:hypothetical protein
MAAKLSSIHTNFASAQGCQDFLAPPNSTDAKLWGETITSASKVAEETTTIKHGPSSFKIGTDTTASAFIELFAVDDDRRAALYGGDYTSTYSGGTRIRGGCWVRFADLPDSGTYAFIQFYRNTSEFARLEVSSAGAITLNDDDATVVISHGSSVAVDTWYYFEWSIDTVNASANQYLWIDGTSGSTTYSFSNAGPTTQTRFRNVQVNGTPTYAACFYEAIWISETSNTTESGAQFTSPATARWVMTANGTNNAWDGVGSTTNKYDNVEDRWEDTAYNHSSTKTEKQDYAHSSTIAGTWSSSISSYEGVVGAISIHRRSAATATGACHIRDSGTAGVYTLVIDPTRETTDEFDVSYGIYRHVDSDGNDWTAARMESVEIGVEHAQTQSRELRNYLAELFILVEISEATAAADNLLTLGVG